MCAHTYADDASFDGTHHWYEITCDHKHLEVEKIAHTDEVGNDGFCEVCQKQFCNHPEATTLTGDKDGHWYAPTCTHTVEITKAPHVDTKDNNGICDDCNYQFCNHTYSDVHSFDANDHWFAPSCGHDVDPIGKENHTDIDGNGVCEVCNNEFCSHDPADTYTYDGKYHWKEAACGHAVPVYEKAEHVDGNSDNVCDACGRSMICEHTFDENVIMKDETHHWYAPNCGHDITDIPEYKVPHADTDDDLHCDFCGGYYEDPNNNGGDINEDEAVETPPHVLTPAV